MSQPIAYHLLLKAIQPKFYSANSRIGDIVRSVTAGFVPGFTYWRAAERHTKLPSLSWMERQIIEHAQVDANPVLALLLLSSSQTEGVRRWNALHSAWQLAIGTRLSECGSGRLIVTREYPQNNADSVMRQMVINSCIDVFKDQLVPRGQAINQLVQCTGSGNWLLHILRRQDDKASAILDTLDVLSSDWVEPNLSLVSKALGVSKRSYQRELQRFELTLPEVRNASRITKSASLLCSTKVSLTEIALGVGFYDAAHFSKAFRLATGVAPSVYRAIATGTG